MHDKIEIMNAVTGEVTTASLSASLSEIVGVSAMNIDEIAEAIAADIKGLSAAKVAEVVGMIADKDLPYFTAIDGLRNGNTKRFRLVVEEVGAATREEAKAICDAIASDPKVISEVMGDGSEKETEAPKEVQENGTSDTIEDAETVDEPVSEEQKQDPETKQVSTSDAHDQGLSARMEGAGPDDNPFDGGTDQHKSWKSGWTVADGGIKDVIQEGYDAGVAGKTRRACEYTEENPARPFWEEGFEKGKAEFDGANAKDGGDQGENANDAYGQGRAAAMAGQGLDANPFGEGLTKHRLWNEGHAAGVDQDA